MQVDQNGDAIDILSSNDFISFIVRSVSEGTKSFLKDSCLLLKIPESEYDIRVATERGLLTVTVNN